MQCVIQNLYLSTKPTLLRNVCLTETEVTPELIKTGSNHCPTVRYRTEDIGVSQPRTT